MENEEQILNFYKKVSMYTNYGSYKNHFVLLPDDIVELSKLICSQVIHRRELIRSYTGKFRDYENKYEQEKIKEEFPWYKYRCYDDILVTVPAMMAELFRQDSRGINPQREIKDKIVVTCRYVACLTASILKAKGIPARVRSGFANYLEPNKNYDHWICQYYNIDEKRWVNLDADGVYDLKFSQWDIPNDKFGFVAKIWLDVRQGKDDAKKYIHGFNSKGLHVLARTLFYDFHALMNDELSYLFFPEYIDSDKKFFTLSIDDLKELDDLATLMLDPDKNFDELRYIFFNDKKLRVLNTPLLSDDDHLELEELN